jgi:hypothetical protein
MKKLLPILFFGLLCTHSYSQVNFEKAYFIDNDNVRTDCFIKNKDLYNSPNSFEYKLNQDESIVKVGEIKDIKEFGINNSMKFERNIVKMDMSSINLDKLSEKGEPEWKDKTLFLRVLIEGEATLYEYKNENMKRYFYKLSNSPVEQLIYKRYFVENSGHTESAANVDFQKQLWSNLRCENSTMDKVLKLEYKKDDLSDYFVEYNKCKNFSFIDYGDKAASGSINFKLKGGMTSSSLQIPYGYSSHIDFDSKVSYNLGAEMEYITPFNKNKWAVFLETSYKDYQVEMVYEEESASGSLFGNSYKWEISHKYIDLGFGLRHYMYINDTSSMFLNASYVFGFPMNSTIKKDNSVYHDIITSMGFSYGFGYSYNAKYSVEFRLSSNRLDKSYYMSQFDTYSVVLGYTLFNNKKQKIK